MDQHGHGGILVIMKEQGEILKEDVQGDNRKETTPHEVLECLPARLALYGGKQTQAMIYASNDRRERPEPDRGQKLHTWRHKDVLNHGILAC